MPSKSNNLPVEKLLSLYGHGLRFALLSAVQESPISDGDRANLRGLIKSHFGGASPVASPADQADLQQLFSAADAKIKANLLAGLEASSLPDDAKAKADGFIRTRFDSAAHKAVRTLQDDLEATRPGPVLTFAPA